MEVKIVSLLISIILIPGTKDRILVKVGYILYMGISQ